MQTRRKQVKRLQHVVGLEQQQLLQKLADARTNLDHKNRYCHDLMDYIAEYYCWLLEQAKRGLTAGSLLRQQKFIWQLQHLLDKQQQECIIAQNKFDEAAKAWLLATRKMRLIKAHQRKLDICAKINLACHDASKDA